MKNFKSLTQVKKELKVGDEVIITNMIYGTKDKRKITKIQTNGIYTFMKNYKRTIFDNNTKKLVEKIEDREVFLDWQKASETRIENNKVYFLKNEYMLEKHIKDIDYWLILEIL